MLSVIVRKQLLRRKGRSSERRKTPRGKKKGVRIIGAYSRMGGGKEPWIGGGRGALCVLPENISTTEEGREREGKKGAGTRKPVTSKAEPPNHHKKTKTENH